eukprot:TRINITY_DN1618_c0_g1_i1.p2 TRINITY_DN1618_c0_g1~~TRINITY_DN1618_c0_g1_i1.p2  ORF type:complete len:363 (-),score=88.05 TRINITY_DN1618_c0_g1_i1:1253-2341(-)
MGDRERGRYSRGRGGRGGPPRPQTRDDSNDQRSDSDSDEPSTNSVNNNNNNNNYRRGRGTGNRGSSRGKPAPTRSDATRWNRQPKSKETNSSSEEEDVDDKKDRFFAKKRGGPSTSRGSSTNTRTRDGAQRPPSTRDRNREESIDDFSIIDSDDEVKKTVPSEEELPTMGFSKVAGSTLTMKQIKQALKERAEETRVELKWGEIWFAIDHVIIEVRIAKRDLPSLVETLLYIQLGTPRQKRYLFEANRADYPRELGSSSSSSSPLPPSSSRVPSTQSGTTRPPRKSIWKHTNITSSNLQKKSFRSSKIKVSKTTRSLKTMTKLLLESDTKIPRSYRKWNESSGNTSTNKPKENFVTSSKDLI